MLTLLHYKIFNFSRWKTPVIQQQALLICKLWTIQQAFKDVIITERLEKVDATALQAPQYHPPQEFNLWIGEKENSVSKLMIWTKQQHILTKILKTKFAQMDKSLLVIAIVSQELVLLLDSQWTKSPPKTTSQLDGYLKVTLIK